ncbi:unnamed protein product [Mortierella alpina]
MYKTSGSTPASLLPTSGSSSPTFRSSHPVARLFKSRVARTLCLGYVGFCALFTLKHLFPYHSKPETFVYRHFDLERTYDPDDSYSVVSNLSSSVILSKCSPSAHQTSQTTFSRSTSAQQGHLSLTKSLWQPLCLRMNFRISSAGRALLRPYFSSIAY